MKRKQIEKEAKRDEILSTARKIFSEKGFENTSMEEIAKKVKIAKGTIYLYFESKYALFLDIVKYARENMKKKALLLQKTNLSSLNKIREMIKIYIDFTTQHPEYLMIFHSIHHQMKKEDREKIMASIHNEEFEEGMDIIALFIKEGIDKGDFKPDLNIPQETFRIFSMFISFGIISNFIQNDPYHATIQGVKIDRQEILWDTVDKILSFYIK